MTVARQGGTHDTWQDAEAIRTWWQSDNQKHISRTYTAETVASMRDVFQENGLSNQMALKLRKLLAEHQVDKSVNLTYSATEAVTLAMMVETGFRSVYVSGGMTSMTDTPTQDPSTDQADYTYDAVPKKVASLMRSQLLHSRTNSMYGHSSPSDYLIPIVADADSGHGLHTATMKLVKLFVQAGVAGVHIDDLLSGAKRYDGKDGVGYVIMPVNEYMRRLRAARLQLDVMGSEMVLIARTDCESATHITSTVDPRDRPYILGATVEQPKDLAFVDPALRDQWLSQARLATLDEAIEAALPHQFADFQRKTSGMNVSEAGRHARKLGVFWDCESCRTAQGWYRFKGCVEASIDRSLLCDNVADMVWSCTTTYNPEATEEYAKRIQDALPGKWMAYNITGGFPADGSQDIIIRDLPDKLARLGYVWQFLPIAGLTALGVGARAAAESIRDEGLLGYIQNISRVAGRKTVRQRR